MECQLNDIHLFVSILQALQLENRKNYSLFISFNRKCLRLCGITQAGDVQAECTMACDAFREYRLKESNNRSEASYVTPCVSHSQPESTRKTSPAFNPPTCASIRTEYSFNLLLMSFLHYIQVFGVGASMILKYIPNENMIHLVLTKKEGRSECHIHALNAEPPLPMPACTESCNNFEIQPQRFRDILMDIHDNSETDSKVTFQIVPATTPRTFEMIPRKGSSSPMHYVLALSVETQSACCTIELPLHPSIFPRHNFYRAERYVYNVKALLTLQKPLAIASSCRIFFSSDGALHATMAVKGIHSIDFVFTCGSIQL